MRIVLVAFVLSLIALGNAQASDARSPVEIDSRLDARVTVEVTHARLDDLLTDLSKKTGVVLKAGSSKRDWRVRERRVTVRAKDITLRDALIQISGLLGYKLSHGGNDGAWSYLIWQDLRARELEEDLAAAQREAEIRKQAEVRQAVLDLAGTALSISEEEARKLADKDPWVAYLGGTKDGRAFSELLSWFGANGGMDYQSAMRGGRVTIPLSSLPARIGQAARTAAMGGEYGARSRGNENLARMEPYQLVITPVSELEPEIQQLLGGGSVAMMTGLRPGEQPSNSGPYGGQMNMIPLTDPGSKTMTAYARALLALEDGKSVSEAGKELTDDAKRDEMIARRSPTEERPPTDPALTREVEVKEMPAPRRSGDGAVLVEYNRKAARSISEALGVPVLIESFAGTMPMEMYIRDGKQPFYRVLVGLEKAGYEWEIGRSVLRIRPTDWALRRSYEIPSAFSEHYRSLLAKQAELSLDDLAEIAVSLTDEQIIHSLPSSGDDEFRAVTRLLTTNIRDGRDILRFYGSLSTAQKQAAASASGLDFSALSEAQWEMLSGLVTERFNGARIASGSIRSVPAKTWGDRFRIDVVGEGESTPRVSEIPIEIVHKEAILRMRKTKEP